MAPIVELQQPNMVAQFDPSREQMAVVSQAMDAHRLRVWDVLSGSVAQEWASDASTQDHRQFTCLAWGSIMIASNNSAVVAVDEQRKKKKRKQPSVADQQLRLIALGTPTGSISLYSPSHGQVWKTLEGSVHTQAITDFVMSADGSRGFSCSTDGWIVEWDVPSASARHHWRADGTAVYRLAMDPSENRLVSAGHDLKLWDLESHQMLKSWTGHGSRVIGLVFSPSGEHIVSISDQDRSVNVWSCAASAQQEGKERPTVVLTLETNVTSVAIHPSGDYLLATTEEGTVNIWQKPFVAIVNEESTASNKNSKKHRRQKKQSRACDCVVQIHDADQQQQQQQNEEQLVEENAHLIPIAQASFVLEQPGSILVAYGSTMRPMFERLSVTENASGSLSKTVRLSRSSSSAALLMDQQSKAKESTAHKGYMEQQSTVVVASHSNTRDMTSAAAMEEQDGTVQASKEQTLAEKLEALNVVEVASPAAGNEDEDAAPDHSRPIPKADSLQQMLVQALRTHDKQLLEECLAVGDSRVIFSTIERLPSPFVLPMLKEIVQRFQARPGRGRALSRWVRSILLVHMSYLMTMPSLSEELAPLYQLVDERLANFKKLLRLQGRLDVIDHQVRQRLEQEKRLHGGAMDGKALTGALQQPRYVFHENQDVSMEEDDEEDSDVDSLIADELAAETGGIDEDFMEDDFGSEEEATDGESE